MAGSGIRPDHSSPAEVWQSKGKQAMNCSADNQPAIFLGTCARLLPNDFRLTVKQSLPGNRSIADWQTMKETDRGCSQALPDASSKPPGEAFQDVLGALTQADAKTISAKELSTGKDSKFGWC